ncbi:MAG: preprotein translocase subunit YajC [Mariprofundaceae bacterium]
MNQIIRSTLASIAAIIASTTPALAADASSTSSFTQLVPLILIMVIFYFLLIRPQQKRAKEHRNMVEGLKKGDKIITTGGIHGSITDVKDDTVKVEIADGVRIMVQRDTILALSV